MCINNNNNIYILDILDNMSKSKRPTNKKKSARRSTKTKTKTNNSINSINNSINNGINDNTSNINSFTNNTISNNNTELIKSTAKQHRLDLTKNSKLFRKSSLSNVESILLYKDFGKYKDINKELWKYASDDKTKLSDETLRLLRLIKHEGATFNKKFFVYRNIAFTVKIENATILEYIKKIQELKIGENIEFNSLMSTALSRPIGKATYIIKIIIPENIKFLFLSHYQREILLLPCSLTKLSDEYFDDVNKITILGDFEYKYSLNTNLNNLLVSL